jgi:hypothetical protein
MQEVLKLSSGGASVVARKANEAVAAPAAVMAVYACDGRMESVHCCWNLVPVAMKIFPRLIYFLKKFYRFVLPVLQ